jgi:hypothetical protein
MSLRRRAAKRDASELAIVAALRAYGFSVAYHSVKDEPDLILGKLGITRWAEVKTGKKQLSEGQKLWWATWNGNGVILLRSVEDVPILAAAWADRWLFYAPGTSIRLTRTQGAA